MLYKKCLNMCSIQKIASLFYGSWEISKCYNSTIFLQGLPYQCIWTCDTCTREYWVEFITLLTFFQSSWFIVCASDQFLYFFNTWARVPVEYFFICVAQKHIHPELGTILLGIVPNSGHICGNICGFCPELGAYM